MDVGFGGRGFGRSNYPFPYTAASLFRFSFSLGRELAEQRQGSSPGSLLSQAESNAWTSRSREQREQLSDARVARGDGYFEY